MEISKFIIGKGFIINGIQHLTPRETFQICSETDNAVILDVRADTMNAYKHFNVKNILYCPYKQIEKNYIHLPNNKLLIVADAVGLRSIEVTRFLKANGFSSIANMAGGIVEWERDGLPLIIDKKEMLSGSCTCQLKKRNKF